MAPDDAKTNDAPRRRDLLKAGGAVGLLGLAGLTMNGVSAQETTTQAEGDAPTFFSYSLQADDLFRVRFRPRDPFGEPATETVPAACLDGDQPQEYQLFIVRAFRGGADLGFRGLLAPQSALAEDLLETTTAGGGGMTETTTEGAMQDQTTTAMGETTTEVGETTTEMAETTQATGDVTEIQLGDWYRVSSAEACDGLNRLSIETSEPPETTPTPSGNQTTTAGGNETTTQ
ncbi:hypothetical protein [Halorussus lipolyticus]|uniref:hypothetical protein n=1 Tax=Halorussus lipolyticus TaxID=3034024 RepID=UPI0023E80C1E|nr:hypothetical protein [Halorussus sp. DT80]